MAIIEKKDFVFKLREHIEEVNELIAKIDQTPESEGYFSVTDPTQRLKLIRDLDSLGLPGLADLILEGTTQNGL